ncbi:hypothetical protein CYMTET_28562, partial [Cymbomonas tetramitiformis]
SLQTSAAEQRTATNAVAGYGTITLGKGSKRRHLSAWVVGRAGVATAIQASDMSHFQRCQLDPTLDYIYSPDDSNDCPPGWFLGTPCPSYQDPVYLHLVLANHLRFIDLSDLVHAPLARDEELRFKTKVYDRDSQPVSTSNQTHVMFEVAVTGLNKEMRVTTGMRMQDTEDGVLVAAAATGNGGFEAVMIGAAHNDYLFENETGVGIVAMLHTMTSMNATADSRSYAFMGSRLLGSIYLPFTSFDFPSFVDPPPSPTPPATPAYSQGEQDDSSGSDGGVSAASAWTWLLLLLGFLAGVALLMGIVYARRRKYAGREPTEEELAIFQEFLADHRRDHIVGDEDYTMNPLRYYEMARRGERDGGNRFGEKKRSSFFESFQARRHSSDGDASKVRRDSYWDQQSNHYNPMVSDLKWMQEGSLLNDMFNRPRFSTSNAGILPLLPEDIPRKVQNPLYEAQMANITAVTPGRPTCALPA